MDLIEKYIKSLYKGNRNKYIEDLKEEIKEHLIEATNNFKSQGYDNEDAQNKAIQDFEDENNSLNNLYIELSKDIEYLNKKNENILNITNILCKLFKYISIFSILILIVLFLLNKSNLILNNQLFEWNSKKSQLDDAIKIVASSNDINDVVSYKDELDTMMKSEDYKYIKDIRIYKDEKYSYSDNESKAVYKYGHDEKNTNSYSFIDSVKGFDGEYWYYRGNIDENFLTKITTIMNNIFIYITPISIIIYIYIKFTLKKINKVYGF